jgi:hypothetical protein
LAGVVFTPNLWTEKEALEKTGPGKRMFRPNATSPATRRTFPKVAIWKAYQNLKSDDNYLDSILMKKKIPFVHYQLLIEPASQNCSFLDYRKKPVLIIEAMLHRLWTIYPHLLKTQQSLSSQIQIQPVPLSIGSRKSPLLLKPHLSWDLKS